MHGAEEAHCSMVQGEASCDGILWVRIRAEATGLDKDLYICGVYVQPKQRKKARVMQPVDPFDIGMPSSEISCTSASVGSSSVAGTSMRG